MNIHNPKMSLAAMPCSPYSDTPETDALLAARAKQPIFDKPHLLPAEFARRLERERDQARNALNREREWMHRKMEAFRDLAKSIL